MRANVRRLSRAVSTATLLSVLVVAGAHAGAAGEPRDLLRGGMLGLAAAPGLTTTFSLDTTTASMQALLADADTPVTAQVAEVLAGTSVQATFPVAVPGDWFGMTVTSGGLDWAEMRVIGGVSYLRADLPAWLDMLGADPALLDEARAELALGGALPPEALEGRWIAITEPDGVVAAASEDNALGRLGMALADSADVELLGSDEHGDRLRVTVSLRTMRDALALELSALTPGGAADLGLPSSQEVPDVPIEVELWVRDGFLTAARFDLLRMGHLDPSAAMPPGVERLAIVAQFQPFDGRIPAPADAIEVDGDRLLESLVGEGFPQEPGEESDGDGNDGGPWPDPAPKAPRVPRETVRPARPAVSAPRGAARAGTPLSLNALLGVGTAQPRPRPPAKAFPDAMAPDQVLLDFYSRPGYGEARRRYCVQLDDVSDAVWARYYADICPGA